MCQEDLHSKKTLDLTQVDVPTAIAFLNSIGVACSQQPPIPSSNSSTELMNLGPNYLTAVVLFYALQEAARRLFTGSVTIELDHESGRIKISAGLSGTQNEIPILIKSCNNECEAVQARGVIDFETLRISIESLLTSFVQQPTVEKIELNAETVLISKMKNAG